MSITQLPFNRTAMATLLATTLTAGISGCGSDGGTSSTTIDGSVFASSVNGASCGIYTGPDDMIGSSFTTSEDGTFSVTIPNGKLAGELVLFCEGGTYTDEVDGSTQTAGEMAAYAAGGTLNADTSFNATPGSSIVFHLITEYDMTPADAEAAFDTTFGYTPDVTIAADDVTNPDMGSSLGAIEAGLRAAAFSQMTNDHELDQNQQFDLLTALAEDLSDGIADGVALSGAVTIPGTSTELTTDAGGDFADAMDNFRTRTVTTSSYKIRYMSLGMDQHGKDQFQVSITDLSDTPVTGLTDVSVMPMMYMADKTHSTPVDGMCDETTPGDYTCTVYYVMPSRMMDGSSMGEWDLKVMVGGMMGEAAHYYPEVMMAMGDTPVVMLRNSNLSMTMMEVTSARTFQIFKSSLTEQGGNHTFELFTSTMETMMSFPAVYQGITLNDGTMTAQSIDGMGIRVSEDPTFMSNVATATSTDDGYWSAHVMSLPTDSEVTLYVEVTINGYILNSSIDGIYVDEGTTPEYGTFTVTTPAPI